MNNITASIYRPSMALLTDFYQLTMAYGYWKSGIDRHESVFHLFFRKPPFMGGYSLAGGLTFAMGLLERFSFTDDDRDYLAGLCGSDGKPIFEKAFLDYLHQMAFQCDVDAVPEGTVVFPHEPLLRVKGPLIQGQILETALLNILNFHTLVATKAARVVHATGGEPVLEFGLRRAQGIDGGLSASWAAYVGGCAGTSNVLAGKLFGIPVKGTHAHSWVMAFDDEVTAFEAYAAAMPNNCLFLVDTYDTLEGVRRAVQVGAKLRERGYEMIGIRLDSGDLNNLSQAARRILDEGGFPDAVIVASNDLNDMSIAELKSKGAKIGTWGVGTCLVTAYDQPTLGGVYKLGAIRAPGEDWKHRLKLSEEPEKISNPGIQQVRRFVQNGEFAADVIYDESLGFQNPAEAVGLDDTPVFPSLADGLSGQDLLVTIFRGGQLVYERPDLEAIRNRVGEQLAQLPERFKRLSGPDRYPVGLSKELYGLKTDLIKKAKRS